MGKKLVTLFAAAVASVILASCAGGTQQPASPESPASTEDRVVITTLYFEELESFEDLVESTYPDIDLQLERSQVATFNSDALRRLDNGHGTDLVFTSMPNSQMADHMLDLSANDFTTRFSSSAMDIISQDGRTMYLPMPSVYRGLIVNETLIGELGLQLPTSQQEFLDVLAAAKAQGKGVDGGGFCFATSDIDGVPLGELILSTAVPDFLGTMEGERWANDFLAQRANAQGTLDPHLQFFVSLTELGYMDASRMNQETMTKDSAHTSLSMADRQLVACYGSSGLLDEIRERNPYDEFTMLPFLSGEGNEPWITTTPAAYLGVNAAVAADQRKLDAVLRVLDLFATPKGQAAILNDSRADSSYLTEPVEGSGVQQTGLEGYVEAGYVYNMNRFNSDVLWLLGNSVSDVCLGTSTLDDAMASVDALNRGDQLPLASNHALVGTVADDLLFENYNTRTGETALGNLVADAVREYAGTQMAFVNGGGIRASLYRGDVHINDVAQVCPYANNIVVLDVTGQVIYQMLENSISEMRLQDTPGGRFLQVSGLSYAYSVDAGTEASAHTQLIAATLPDGTPLDPSATYRIAVNDYLCGISGYESAGDNYTMLNVFDANLPLAQDVMLVEVKDGAAADALVAYFESRAGEPVRSVIEGRIRVEGGA